MRSILESLTLGELAYRVEESTKNQQDVPAPPVRPVQSRDADLPLSLAQQRLWFLIGWRQGIPSTTSL